MRPVDRDEPELRTAHRGDLEAIGLTLGEAFHDDPVANWLVGRRRVSVERTGRLYTALADGHLSDGLSTITSGVEAVAVWAAPKRFRIPASTMLPHLGGVLRVLGPAGLTRMLRMSEVEKLHPGESHYYLAVLGTHPDHQGRGLGSAVMEPTLARADREGVACYLESSKESNLAFYHRHHFEVTGTHDLAGGRGPRLWLMWREPRPA